MINKDVNKNYKTKSNIILILLIFLLFISSVIYVYILIKHNTLKHNNVEIKNEIIKIQDNILTIDNEYNTNSLGLERKKIELQEKIEEYNIWLEIKEKIK